MTVKIIEHFDLKPAIGRVKGGSAETLNLVLDKYQANVRGQIAHLEVGWNSGQTSPGRKNSLRAAVKKKPDYHASDKPSGSVFVDPNSPAFIYSKIHEDGGIIRAKGPKGYLIFRIDGRWIQVRQVRITPKRYFFNGTRITKSWLRGHLKRTWWRAMQL